MKPKISIGSCRRAIGIAGDGIPLMIRGERVLRGSAGSAEISAFPAPARKSSP